MAQLINEAQRFQKLAGIIKESQLNEEIDNEIKSDIFNYFKNEPESLKKIKDFSSKGGVLGLLIKDMNLQLDSSGNISIVKNGKPITKYNNYVDFFKNIGLQAESLDIEAKYLKSTQAESQLDEADTSIIGSMAKNLYLYLNKLKPNNPVDVNGAPLKNVKGDVITRDKKVKMSYQNSKLANQGKAKTFGNTGGEEVTISSTPGMVHALGFVKKEEAKAALKYILDKYPNQFKGLHGNPEVYTNKMEYEWAKNYAPDYSFALVMKDDKEIAKSKSARPTAPTPQQESQLDEITDDEFFNSLAQTQTGLVDTGATSAGWNIKVDGKVRLARATKEEAEATAAKLQSVLPNANIEIEQFSNPMPAGWKGTSLSSKYYPDLEEVVNEALSKFRKKEQTNEIFGLFGNKKSKEKKGVKMAQLINEAQRFQKLANIKEAIASVDHLEVGEEYNYKSGVEGKPPVKIKVTKLVGGKYFVGEILEDNETTKYKGWNKGDKYQLNTSDIVEKSTKEQSANNPVVEPKNDEGEKNPKATEAFNKVAEWAKQNKLKTVGQVSEYGANDIYIRLWSGGFLDTIISTSKEKELVEFLKTLGGKMSRTHMDEETKGARIGLNFEEVKESIESAVNEALSKFRKQK
jgi:hypothetical protein